MCAQLVEAPVPVHVRLMSTLPLPRLNVSTSVPFALIGAAVTLLDDIATSVVAAATASVYISDQSHGIVAANWMTVVLLGVLATVGLIGVRGSAGVTLATLGLHVRVFPRQNESQRT